MVEIMDHPTRCMVPVKIPRQLFNFEKKIPLCTTLKHYEEYGGVQPNQIDTCLFKGETVEAVITVVMNLAQMVPTLIGTPSSETQYHPHILPVNPQDLLILLDLDLFSVETVSEIKL